MLLTRRTRSNALTGIGVHRQSGFAGAVVSGDEHTICTVAPTIEFRGQQCAPYNAFKSVLFDRLNLQMVQLILSASSLTPAGHEGRLVMQVPVSCLMLSHGQLDFVGITQGLSPFLCPPFCFFRRRRLSGLPVSCSDSGSCRSGMVIVADRLGKGSVLCGIAMASTKYS